MEEADGAFSVRETHGILWRPENRVHAASEGLGWTSLYASAQRETPYEASYAAVRDHLVILHLDDPVGVGRVLGRTRERRVVAPGGLFILPGGAAFGVRLEAGLDSLHVYLRDAVLREVAAEFARGDPGRVEIVPRLGDRDPLVEQLALGIRDALTDPDPGAPVYADHLARMLGARLLRAHSNRAPPPAQPRRGGLTRPQLARAVEFMEANLAGPLRLEALAGAAGVSPAHFARRFKASLGTAPHQHLMRLRVERAERLLRETDRSIAQIAHGCGFSHEEHMTRLFGRLVGMPPGVFRATAP